MISPDELKAKALRKFDLVVGKWIVDRCQSLFPMRIPADLSVGKKNKPQKLQSDLLSEMERLRRGSKEYRRFGYRIHWEEQTNRKHGLNQYPTQIWVDSLDDYLEWVGQKNEFRGIINTVEELRKELPHLEPWIVNSWKELVQVRETISELIILTKFLVANPNPGCFPRQLPLPISTKLVENHKKLLSAWFDILLEANTIDCSRPSDFYSRYGFRTLRPHRAMRIIDPALKDRWQIRFEEFSLPYEEIGQLPAKNLTVIIVENKTNLYCLPNAKDCVGIWGQGNYAEELHLIDWFHRERLIYWGDLDVEGFAILSRLRRHLPHVESLMMDWETLKQFENLGTIGNQWKSGIPEFLTDSERLVFEYLQKNHLRIEQEHITQSYVDARLSRVCELL